MKNKKKFSKFYLFVKRRIFDHKTFYLQHGYKNGNLKIMSSKKMN